MRHRSFRFLMPGIVLMSLMWSGISGPVLAADNMEANIARLYLNHKQLKILRDDLHGKTVESFQGAELQSSYIRQANLFISESDLICYYQWRLLSTRPYIKATHQKDFHTLRVKDLKEAIRESEQRVLLLNLYSGYIEDDGTREIIAQAIGIIEGNVYLFDSLLDAITPLAHPPNRFQAGSIIP